MSAENKNKFIKGSFIFGGRYCVHCSELGISCDENGLLLSEGKVGQIVVHIEGVGNLKVPGKLQNCKIAVEQTPQKEGAYQIRKAGIEEIKDDTANYEEIVESNLSNWS